MLCVSVTLFYVNVTCSMTHFVISRHHFAENDEKSLMHCDCFWDVSLYRDTFGVMH